MLIEWRVIPHIKAHWEVDASSYTVASPGDVSRRIHLPSLFTPWIPASNWRKCSCGILSPRHTTPHKRITLGKSNDNIYCTLWSFENEMQRLPAFTDIVDHCCLLKTEAGKIIGFNINWPFGPCFFVFDLFFPNNKLLLIRILHERLPMLAFCPFSLGTF